MSADPAMSLVEVRDILGHASITTTQLYTTPRREDVIAHAQAHFARRTAASGVDHPPAAPPAARLGYDDADLAELFGGDA